MLAPQGISPGCCARSRQRIFPSCAVRHPCHEKCSVTYVWGVACLLALYSSRQTSNSCIAAFSSMLNVSDVATIWLKQHGEPRQVAKHDNRKYQVLLAASFQVTVPCPLKRADTRLMCCMSRDLCTARCLPWIVHEAV